jgi:hypothetical protein
LIRCLARTGSDQVARLRVKPGTLIHISIPILPQMASLKRSQAPH